MSTPNLSFEAAVSRLAAAAREHQEGKGRSASYRRLRWQRMWMAFVDVKVLLPDAHGQRGVVAARRAVKAMEAYGKAQRQSGPGLATRTGPARDQMWAALADLDQAVAR